MPRTLSLLCQDQKDGSWIPELPQEDFKECVKMKRPNYRIEISTIIRNSDQDSDDDDDDDDEHSRYIQQLQ